MCNRCAKDIHDRPSSEGKPLKNQQNIPSTSCTKEAALGSRPAEQANLNLYADLNIKTRHATLAALLQHITLWAKDSVPNSRDNCQGPELTPTSKPTTKAVILLCHDGFKSCLPQSHRTESAFAIIACSEAVRSFARWHRQGFLSCKRSEE